MNEAIQKMIDSVPNATADHIMAISAVKAMRTKLNRKRDEGRGGWFTSDCSNKVLLEMLKEHIEKGDMIDVMNFAGMIWMREQLYGKDA